MEDIIVSSGIRYRRMRPGEKVAPGDGVVFWDDPESISVSNGSELTMGDIIEDSNLTSSMPWVRRVTSADDDHRHTYL